MKTRRMQADMPPDIEKLRRKYFKALSDVTDGLQSYQEVMRKFSRSGEDNIERIGKRGMNTVENLLDRWSAIGDDWFVAENDYMTSRVARKFVAIRFKPRREFFIKEQGKRQEGDAAWHRLGDVSLGRR